MMPGIEGEHVGTEVPWLVGGVVAGTDLAVHREIL